MDIFVYILIMIGAVIGSVLLVDIVSYLMTILSKPCPQRADEKKDILSADFETAYKNLTQVYLHFTGEQTDVDIDDNMIEKSIKIYSHYIYKRYDCADFRMQLFLRFYFDCKDKLSVDMRRLVEDTILDFKYFMDQPGKDSMCYWSENHQILFAVAEYLAGDAFQKSVFTNSNETGLWHKENAEKRILAWTEQRFNFGYSEYLSNVYLLEDLAPIGNFLEYAKDEQLKTRIKIALDLLWLDTAFHTTNGRFVACSSRMYAGNKSSNLGNSIHSCMDMLFYDKAYSDVSKSSMSVCFCTMVKRGHYTLPKVIKDIALNQTPVVSKIGSGLSPEDMTRNNLVGLEANQIMAQWGAESFTNPGLIQNTFDYIKKNKMFDNNFINYFKYFDLGLFKILKLEKLARKFNFMTHGIALGRGNIYGYKTKDYVLSTLVNKEADQCGAQEHIWSANIADEITLFTTYPTTTDAEKSSSPGYWVGNCRRPMSVQDKNVNLTIYKIDYKKRPLERGLSQMTHSYMPKAFYDEFVQSDSMILARKGKVLVAFITNGKMEYNEYSDARFKALVDSRFDRFSNPGEFDLMQKGGDYHKYITELSSTDNETFAQFADRIRSAKIDFSDNKIVYQSDDRQIEADFSGAFFVNGVIQGTVFNHYESDYVTAERQSSEIVVKKDENSLRLNYGNLVRETIEN